MPSDIYKALMDQTKSIAKSNVEVFKSEGPKPKKWTPVHLDTCTPEHLPRQVSRHLHTCTPEHLPTQVDTYTSEQVDTCTPKQVDPLNSDLKPKDLKLNQYRVLHEIYFNRPFKVKGPERIGKNANIPYGTVRNILKSLVKKGYISKPFSINDGVNKGTTCQVNESKCVPIFGTTKIINSEHVDNRTPEQQDNRTPAHVDTFYKKERKILYNNLSFYLENSDFWKQQGLSLQKCQCWIDELSFCDPDMLLQQLQYAEFMDKVKTADNPISYFYRTLKKGCFTRPTGFEFPEEKAERLQKEELETRQKALASLEKIREQEKKLADKEAFYAFLADKESVTTALDDIGSQFVTPTFKISLKVYHDSGKIDSRLGKRLKQYFLAD